MSYVHVNQRFYECLFLRSGCSDFSGCCGETLVGDPDPECAGDTDGVEMGDDINDFLDSLLE